jgi:peptide/nickel transport system permease protein
VTEATIETLAAASPEASALRRRSISARLFSNWSVRISGLVLLVLVLMAIFAPWLGTLDPTAIDPSISNALPGTHADFTTLDGNVIPHWFLMGTDSLGRDIWSRTLYGGRVSIVVGLSVAVFAVTLGVPLGLMAGYFKWLDSIVMRIMDGVMAIPGILLAVTLIALFGGTLTSVVIAIALPEVPRVARLVRSLVLSIREEPYVEAAVALATPTWKILVRHVLPNSFAPLIIQATYVCASSILVEAILSFLGIGLPADLPSWGNVMAEGRSQFNQFPHNVLFPGIFLALTVLAVNMLGDGLRDTLDPKFNKRGE